MKRLKHVIVGLVLGTLLSVALAPSAGVRDYSTTAASNASVSGQNWAEGMAPSAVNDSARKALADLAELYQLLGGTLTTGGTANAQTLTPTVAWTAYTNGDRVLTRIGSGLTNTGSTTLNVSALGTKTVYKPDGTSTLSGGEIVAGAIVEFVYDSTLGGFRIVGTTPSLDEVTTNGADIASAGTLDLDAATGDTVDVTGTTTITAITLAAGDMRIVRFTGALTLTHGASLVLPGSANITTAAGDFAIFRGYASSVVRCLHYQRLSGGPTVAAATSDLTSGGNSKVVTPGTIKRYSTTGQTVAANSTLTLAHGLGAKPFFVQLSIVMGASTEGGFAEGDEVLIGPNDMGSSAADGIFSVLLDATNVTIVMANAASSIVLANKSTRAAFTIDNTKWTLTVRASL